MLSDRVRAMLGQALFLLILGASCVLMYMRLSTGHVWGDDFSGYLGQAKSLVEGAVREYVASNGYAMGHSSRTLGPSAYPWGLPALLAPLYAIWGLNLLVLKTVGLACYAAFLLVLHRGFAQEHPGVWRLLLVGLFAFHPKLMGFVDTIMADIPFLLFSTLAMVLIQKVLVERRTILSVAWDPALLGLAVATAFAVRSNGILLLPALALAQLLGHLAARKELREAPQAQQAGDPRSRMGRAYPILAPYAVFLLLAVGMGLFLPSGDASYVEYWKRITPEYAFGNVRYYAWLPTEFFLGLEGYYHLSIPFLLIGLAQRWRRDLPVLAYVLLTLLFFCIWPSKQGLRYLLPVIPFYVSFALTGVQAVAGWLRRTTLLRPLAWGAVLIPAAFVFQQFQLSLHLSSQNLRNERTAAAGPFTPVAQDMFRFVADSTGPEDVIIFRKARIMRLMTGRMSLVINTVDGLAAGDYLVLGQEQGLPRLLPEGVEPGVSFPARLVYQNEMFAVYDLR